MSKRFLLTLGYLASVALIAVGVGLKYGGGDAFVTAGILVMIPVIFLRVIDL